MNPLVDLQAYGQSFWYDNIRRKFLHDGTLQSLIDDDGLRGMTSNPSIFQKAIGHSDDYDDQIRSLTADGAEATVVYESLVLADIQAACNLFAALYAESDMGDGFVSLEVSPHLAQDTNGTIQEARRLFRAVNRPNVMIKVPATPEGIPAIRQLIGEGINVNVTLMFNMAHYEVVAQAYIDGLNQLQANGGDLARVASVASFFVSRVDTAVDNKLTALDTSLSKGLLGKVAVANSRLVYQRFKQIFHGETFRQLQAAGANCQRLLWASTSTKNPAYSQTLYVDELIGPETVNTMPPNTVDAFRESGRLGRTLDSDLDAAQQTIENLAALGIDLAAITEQLQDEGVAAFAGAFDTLMAAIVSKMSEISR